MLKRTLLLPLLMTGIVWLPLLGQEPEKNENYRNSEAAYQQALRAFGAKRYEQALENFDRVLAMDTSHKDAALYWMASAHFKMSQWTFAQQQLNRLLREFPDSSWVEDAHALEAEIAAASGKDTGRINVESLSPSAVMVALMNLPQKDAIPIIESLLEKDTDVRYKEQALFALTQFSGAEARTILEGYASDQQSPLGLPALRYLALSPDEDTLDFLSGQYASSTSMDRKMEILTAFMLAKDTERLLTVATTEENTRLSTQAITLLGAMGEHEMLADLYIDSPDVETKRAILQSTAFSRNTGFLNEIIENEPNTALKVVALQQLGIGGDCLSLRTHYKNFTTNQLKLACLEAMFIGQRCAFLEEVAETEPADNLRQKAITFLGIIGGDYLDTLSRLYRTTDLNGDKKAIIQALFIHKSAEPLLEIYEMETDPELKRLALQMLSLMPSRIELPQKNRD